MEGASAVDGIDISPVNPDLSVARVSALPAERLEFGLMGYYKL